MHCCTANKMKGLLQVILVLKPLAYLYCIQRAVYMGTCPGCHQHRKAHEYQMKKLTHLSFKPSYFLSLSRVWNQWVVSAFLMSGYTKNKEPGFSLCMRLHLPHPRFFHNFKHLNQLGGQKQNECDHSCQIHRSPKVLNC